MPGEPVLGPYQGGRIKAVATGRVRAAARRLPVQLLGKGGIIGPVSTAPTGEPSGAYGTDALGAFVWERTIIGLPMTPRRYR